MKQMKSCLRISDISFQLLDLFTNMPACFRYAVNSKQRMQAGTGSHYEGQIDAAVKLQAKILRQSSSYT